MVHNLKKMKSHIEFQLTLSDDSVRCFNYCSFPVMRRSVVCCQPHDNCIILADYVRRTYNGARGIVGRVAGGQPIRR